MTQSTRGLTPSPRSGFAWLPLGCVVVLAMSLAGCDYWPPALHAQIEELHSMLQDAWDTKDKLEEDLRQAQEEQETLRTKVDELSRVKQELLRRVAALERQPVRQRRTAAVHASSSSPQQPSRYTATRSRVLKHTARPMTGRDVRRVQQLLRNRNLPVQVDGVFGPTTRAAVRWFQRAQGLPADGVVGPATYAALHRASRQAQLPRTVRVQRPGTEGRDVRLIQRALRRAGYSVSIDGTYGQQTKRAVARFQRRHGLRADGVVGPRTWAALSSSRR